MTFVLGLTGSIGMGKSTTAAMFADLGVPVWDADAVVRGLYASSGAAAAEIAKIYPDVIENGAVSRPLLRALIAADPSVLDYVQSLVHPLVAADRAAFLAQSNASVVVLDIPLLFETGADGVCDGVVVVTTSADAQKQRVMDRGEMTEAEFDLIVSRQMPDADKRAKARWLIETTTLDAARRSVTDIVDQIKAEQSDA